MKQALFILFLFSLLYLKAIEISGDQSGTWSSADNPYEMIGNITVPAGELLQIEAGVEVVAMGNFRITVLGNLVANGTAADTIRFHGNEGINWGGLRFENEAGQSELYYCRVSHTDDINDYGIHSVNSPILVDHCHIDDHQKGVSFSGLSSANPSYMEIRHTKIANVLKSGITIVDNSNVLIDSCEVTQCGLGPQYYGAIQLSLQSNSHNCSPEITNNHIHHNGKQGITMANLFDYSTMAPVITGNLIEHNLTGIYLYSAQGYIHNNQIMNNFIAGDANSGAGVMLYGASAEGVFTGNEVSGNFTGFYLTAGATANIGNVENASDLDDGMNYIHDNIDEYGNVYSIYNDSSAEVMAQNNLWDSADPDEIAETIIDAYDNMTSGEVIFEPLYWYTTPPAPENLELAINIQHEIYLSWEFEEILGFEYFNIYSSHEFGPYEIIGTSVEPEFTYEDMPGDGGGQYYFYVTAVNVHEIESDSSNVIEYYYVEADDFIAFPNLTLDNYPNPFNPSTTISFTLTDEGNSSKKKNDRKQIDNTEIFIFNSKGQKVRNLVKGNFSPGHYSVEWDGKNEQGETVCSGFYFIILQAGSNQISRKILLLK
ncbi:MAG: hypothetical protein APR54_07100 [Candidatus Cloacimonas sp. SDB]|nr:MAG: hypothetical protein APR54_07100 [Candidatus Cloacimonas sp. SDB]